MTAAISKISIVIFSLKFFRAMLYSLIVTGEAFKAAVTVTPWSAMTSGQQIVLVVSLFIIQAGVILAFLDQTISTLSNSPKPVGPAIPNT